MKKIPINKKEGSSLNKKAITLILVLAVCGIITGVLLSSYFVNDANNRILRFDDNPKGGRGQNLSQNFSFDPEPLTPEEAIVPSIGVVIVCITTYLLIGLIAVYIKIFMKTGSKYIAGLLFFLTPLFLQSIFSVNTLRSLFVSSAIPFNHIRDSIGFGIGGLGGILVIVSIFEIIGLSILLYLSTE